MNLNTFIVCIEFVCIEFEHFYCLHWLCFLTLDYAVNYEMN